MKLFSTVQALSCYLAKSISNADDKLGDVDFQDLSEDFSDFDTAASNGPATSSSKRSNSDV